MDFPHVIFGIDPSLNGTGLCVLKDSRPVFQGTIGHKTIDGYGRLTDIRKTIMEILDIHQPTLVQLEGLSLGSNMNSVVTAAEISGCIKQLLDQYGFGFGQQAVKEHPKACLVVSPMTMKKFCLGHGNIEKDERYLLKILETININFPDSNQADAYMHATMAGIVAQVMRGEVPLSNLPIHQQESLISERRAKHILKMGKTKAMKQPDDKRVLCIDDFNP